MRANGESRWCAFAVAAQQGHRAQPVSRCELQGTVHRKGGSAVYQAVTSRARIHTAQAAVKSRKGARSLPARRIQPNANDGSLSEFSPSRSSTTLSNSATDVEGTGTAAGAAAAAAAASPAAAACCRPPFQHLSAHSAAPAGHSIPASPHPGSPCRWLRTATLAGLAASSCRDKPSSHSRTSSSGGAPPLPSALLLLLVGLAGASDAAACCCSS